MFFPKNPAPEGMPLSGTAFSQATLFLEASPNGGEYHKQMNLAARPLNPFNCIENS
jgi:hypothetical protein